MQRTWYNGLTDVVVFFSAKRRCQGKLGILEQALDYMYTLTCLHARRPSLPSYLTSPCPPQSVPRPFLAATSSYLVLSPNSHCNLTALVALHLSIYGFASSPCKRAVVFFLLWGVVFVRDQPWCVALCVALSPPSVFGRLARHRRHGIIAVPLDMVAPSVRGVAESAGEAEERCVGVPRYCSRLVR